MAIPAPNPGLAAFLRPLQVDRDRTHTLSREFASTFAHLAAESMDQFLPTPISESILLPPKKKSQGRYLAIDIGGTNLRVGFIELLATDEPPIAEAAGSNGLLESPDLPRLRRLLERSWPIQDYLKTENADSLFAWIGSCIAAVVREGCAQFNLPRDVPLPMGVTFSFPMEQESLSEAKLMSMGKGFTITSKLDLGSHLIKGYEKARAGKTEGTDRLPPITIAAIANDSVATLVSFVYELPPRAHQKAAMGLICGTGSNATLLLKRSSLHPSKRPRYVNVIPEDHGSEQGRDNQQDRIKLAVNTEWSINGSAVALRAVDFISRWDDQLSQTVEYPGFQPLEYMTAGRYLGELGRVMLVDYITNTLGVAEATLPSKFLQRFEPHNTTFLSHYRPGLAQPLLALLQAEFPLAKENGQAISPNGTAAVAFEWTQEMAEALYHIAKAIEVRAAAIIAAATVGLLDCAEELPERPQPLELVVGYTGGCITNFQDYLADCQTFLDDLMTLRYGSPSPVRIVLRPCHDGGIKGAGILVPASLASQGAAPPATAGKAC